MKPAARNAILLIPAVVWLALCATLVGAAAPPSTAPTTTTTSPAAARTGGRDLLAFGTDQRFWSADVIPVIQGKTQGTKTFLRVRGPGDSQWRLVGELEAAAVTLAHRANELLVVLDNGDWRIVSDTGARSGNPLPGGADVLAMAGDGDDVWAIGVGPVVPVTPATTTTTSTSTAPATTPAAAAAVADAPTTTTTATPAAGDVVSLYHLLRGDWARREPLPPHLDRDDFRVVSLAVLDRKLTLAVVDSDGVVRVFTSPRAGDWDKGQELAVVSPGNTRLRLLDLSGGRPALWVSDATGPGALYIAGGGGGGGGGGGARWQGPVRLAPFPKLGSYDRTALATALGQLRLLASDGKQQLAEQIYKEDGSLSGPVSEVVTAPSALDNRVAQVVQMFIIAVLFIWMMGALRQRPDTQEAAKRADQLNLAPMGRRVVGGAIDLLPVLIGMYVAAEFAPPSGADGAAAAMTYSSPQFAWIAAGIAVYLLHTTAFELVFARSPGKFVTATRVVALDGTRPTTVALLTRNLLRIVDIILVFPPVFVFFSPLRQRVGDMAAGTLVVNATPTERGSDEDPFAPRSDEGNAPPSPPAPPSAD